MPKTPLYITIALFSLLILAGCAAGAPAAAAQAQVPETGAQSATCPVTVPELATPPEDSAVLNEPAPGYYYLNPDQSIWAASVGWGEAKAYHWSAGEQGNKVGWFRPAGADLQITGRRLDGDSLPLQAEVPCCYPTRFQATGLIFPTPGCWEVTAKAAESELTFVVEVSEE